MAVVLDAATNLARRVEQLDELLISKEAVKIKAETDPFLLTSSRLDRLEMNKVLLNKSSKPFRLL